MSIPKLYTRLITAKDILENFGYDMLSIAEQGAFATKEKAVDAWLDEACESINGLILNKRGAMFTKALNEFIADEKNKNDILYRAMYWSQMYEMRFFIDNGRFAAVGKIDIARKLHDDEAINTLYAYGILKDGAM